VCPIHPRSLEKLYYSSLHYSFALPREEKWSKNNNTTKKSKKQRREENGFPADRPTAADPRSLGFWGRSLL
jgi:hypothetical protein